MKSADEETTNGIASFFSFAYRPGAMNNHTCSMMYGDAISTPVSAAIFNISMKPLGGLGENQLPAGNVLRQALVDETPVRDR